VIHELIAKEKTPLTDQDIVEILRGREHGIVVGMTEGSGVVREGRDVRAACAVVDRALEFSRGCGGIAPRLPFWAGAGAAAVWVAGLAAGPAADRWAPAQ